MKCGTFWTEVGTGAVVGLLTGALLGLSTSPIVGTVVSGLVALSAAFFGLVSTATGTKITITPTTRLRLGTFCVMAVIAMLASLYARANNLLSPNSANRYAEWKALGFKDDEARKLVVQEFLGKLDGTSEGVLTGKSERTVLFHGDMDLCARLDPDPIRHPNLDELLATYEAQGEPWKRIAAEARRMNMSETK
jgi:hypothetical protein